MGRGKKRKHHEVVPAQEVSSTFGLRQTLDKARNVLQDSSRGRDPPEDDASHVAATDDAGDGWQTVSHKPTKSRKQTGAQQSHYPQLVFHTKRTVPVTIADLQQLVLYTLADGVSPNWVAFKHAHHIKKVVVLMVPGLEKELFDGTLTFNDDDEGKDTNGHATTHADAQDPGQGLASKPAQPSESPERSDFEVWKTGQIPTSHTDSISPSPIVSSSLMPVLKPMASIFDQVWPIRAPGDIKYAKVHSPLQAMLLSPLPNSKDKDQQSSRVLHEQQVKPVRTPLSHFIHSADELREADYPVHPAAFTSSSDAELERERRDKTNQSASSGWVDTDVAVSCPNFPQLPKNGVGSPTQGLQVYAIDCEMVLTSDDAYSLARISVIDWSGNTILDKYVKPSLPIKNYYTQYSGITPALLENVTTTLSDIQKELLTLFTSSTVILGHSLESDLNALKMTHPFIIDTGMIYPHPRGPPLRSSLKFLANKYLKREIQSAGANGHNSLEDALAVLDLVKLKCEKGPKWGTSETSGEPIFRRLARTTRKDGQPRPTALVDHGAPERGYGREATFTIGCASDDAVVQGIIRAVQGDPDGHEIPAGGVDFVWARLRELERIRGWCNNNREYDTVDELHQPQNNSTDVTTTLKSTITHITRIHTSLPPCTLLIIYSGTSDPREVGRLQKMQAQYRREFKVKRWDELSVKWTDTEEQALRVAVERARAGCGFMCVK